MLVVIEWIEFLRYHTIFTIDHLALELITWASNNFIKHGFILELAREASGIWRRWVSHGA